MKRRLTWSTLLLAALLAACAVAAPTATPQPIPMPAPMPTTFSPEAPASAPADIAGVWLFHLRGQGGLVQSECDFTIRADGTYTIDDKSGMHVEKGTYTISAGKLVLESDECYRNSTATFYHCVGTYMAFSTKDGARPVSLRLVMVDDQGDRAQNSNNRTLALDGASQ